MSDHVKYIAKTRDYYLSQGYAKPYEWARFDDVPFTPLEKPLSECRATLVSTSEIAARDVDDADLHGSAKTRTGQIRKTCMLR